MNVPQLPVQIQRKPRVGRRVRRTEGPPAQPPGRPPSSHRSSRQDRRRWESPPKQSTSAPSSSGCWGSPRCSGTRAASRTRQSPRWSSLRGRNTPESVHLETNEMFANMSLVSNYLLLGMRCRNLGLEGHVQFAKFLNKVLKSTITYLCNWFKSLIKMNYVC